MILLYSSENRGTERYERQKEREKADSVLPVFAEE
jgi:hypothetical protein